MSNQTSNISMNEATASETETTNIYCEHDVKNLSYAQSCCLHNTGNARYNKMAHEEATFEMLPGTGLVKGPKATIVSMAFGTRDRGGRMAKVTIKVRRWVDGDSFGNK